MNKDVLRDEIQTYLMNEIDGRPYLEVSDIIWSDFSDRLAERIAGML